MQNLQQKLFFWKAYVVPMRIRTGDFLGPTGQWITLPCDAKQNYSRNIH
jgi:hypothetical protein